MTIQSDRLHLLDTIELAKGNHRNFESGVCFLEAVA